MVFDIYDFITDYVKKANKVLEIEESQIVFYSVDPDDDEPLVKYCNHVIFIKNWRCNFGLFVQNCIWIESAIEFVSEKYNVNE